MEIYYMIICCVLFTTAVSSSSIDATTEHVNDILVPNAKSQTGCSAWYPCQNGGYCNAGFCLCQKGTRGAFCEVIDECSYLCPNTNGVTCTYDVSSQRAYCRCLNNNLIYNPNTRQCRFPCSANNPCRNGGYCSAGFCFCPKGTRGQFCEVVDECIYLCPNNNGVTCAYDVSSQRAYCSCLNNNLVYNPNTKFCQPRVIGCNQNNPCQNGGYCNAGYCFCQKGTRGQFCEVIDECSYLCPNTNDVKCFYDVSYQRAYCRCLNGNLIYNPNTRICQSRVSTCQTDNHCVNGVCRNGACQCLPGTWGDRCENVDCVSGAITCVDQIYLLWKGRDTLYILWIRKWILMKFVRQDVIVPYVNDCQNGARVKCNNFDILSCHNGYTVYVPTQQNQWLRYRRVDSTGATCSGNVLPRTQPHDQSEKKSEFEKMISLQRYVNYVGE